MLRVVGFEFLGEEPAQPQHDLISDHHASESVDISDNRFVLHMDSGESLPLPFGRGEHAVALCLVATLLSSHPPPENVSSGFF